MVDRQTARFLVYGTLGTLALVLLVAVVALTQKKTLGQTLESKLAEIERKQEELELEKQKLAQAHQRKKEAELNLRREQNERRAKEAKRDELEQRLNEASQEAGKLQKEAGGLRKRIHDDEGDEREELEKLSDDELHRQLEEEAREFNREQGDLELEDLDEDDLEDLKKQKDTAKNLEEEWGDVNKYLESDGGTGEEAEERKKHASDGLERLQEYGEQNEVFLEDLEKDAEAAKSRGGKKWKEPTRPKRMQKLVRDMDQRAEVLRNRFDEKKLDESDEALEKVKKWTHKLMNSAKEREGGAPAQYQDERLNRMANDVEERERRLKLELLQADDEEALKQAKALEGYSIQVQKQVADLERLARQKDDKRTPEEKAEHREAIDYFQNELINIENEALRIERGFERRRMRREAVLTAKAANQVFRNKDVENLKHGKRSETELKQLLGTEGSMLQVAKDARAGDKQVEVSRKLSREADAFRRDSKKLLNEAEAHRFDKLDEQISAQREAKNLNKAAKGLQRAAEDIGDSNLERNIRNAAHNVDLGAAKIRDEKEFQKVRPHWQDVRNDAEELEHAIGERNLEKEIDASKKTVEDIQALEQGAKDLEKELLQPSVPLTPERRHQYMQAIKDMQGHAAALRKYVEVARDDAVHKVNDKIKELKEEQQEVMEVHGNAERKLRPLTGNADLPLPRKRKRQF